MKYYAREYKGYFDPEYYNLSELVEDKKMVICGNEDYEVINISLFKTVKRFTKALFDLLPPSWLSEIDYKEEAKKNKDTIIECLSYYIDMNKINVEDVINGYYDYESDNRDLFSWALSLITGVEYDYEEFCGSVQREWNTIYYPVGTKKEDIEYYTCLYFGLGSEWEIFSDANCEYKEGDLFYTGYDFEDAMKVAYEDGYINENDELEYVEEE